MRHSMCTVAVALLLYTSAVVAGGPDAMRASYRGLSAAHLYGSSSGCECGCGAETSCDAGCDPCRPARCGLLPKLFGGLDCMLQQLYCNPCNIPSCRPRLCLPTCCSNVWAGYSSECDCGGDSGAIQHWPSDTKTNPFVDDELRSPPPVPKDVRYKNSTPRSYPVPMRRPQYTSAPKKAASPKATAALEPKPAAPAKANAVVETKATPAVEPKPDAPRTDVSSRKTPRPVRQVKHETSSKKIVPIPKNPLRGE